MPAGGRSRREPETAAIGRKPDSNRFGERVWSVLNRSSRFKLPPGPVSLRRKSRDACLRRVETGLERLAPRDAVGEAGGQLARATLDRPEPARQLPGSDLQAPDVRPRGLDRVVHLPDPVAQPEHAVLDALEPIAQLARPVAQLTGAVGGLPRPVRDRGGTVGGLAGLVGEQRERGVHAVRDRRSGPWPGRGR